MSDFLKIVLLMVAAGVIICALIMAIVLLTDKLIN